MTRLDLRALFGPRVRHLEFQLASLYRGYLAFLYTVYTVYGRELPRLERRGLRALFGPRVCPRPPHLGFLRARALAAAVELALYALWPLLH